MSEITLEDVQAQTPALAVSLSRVGVTNVEKVIRIEANGSEQLYSARLDCFVDLGPQQKGAHMSRFEEVVNDAIGEVVIGEAAFRAETLAQHIAEKVRDRQGARRAEVRIEARYPEDKPAPVSGIETQEIYSLLGVAVASAAGTRRLIVEGSMSSEIYELMKRTDEGAVVEKAHRRPRFVEDCVREMVRGVVERFDDLTDRHFVSARQENLETIHQHNVTAERFGLVGEMRRELHTGEHSEHHVSMREWLDGLA